MRDDRAQTIVALATPPGRGAIGIVRLSGPAVPDIARALLGALPPPRQARLATFRAADGEPLDQGLALYFAAPASFTGEPLLELHAHGGPVLLDRLIVRVLELGARPARPGEFSERAFLNGKMDLASAEAVADLIEAGTAAAARAAVRSLRGEFSARIRGLERGLIELRAQIEASIDFVEEDLELPSREAWSARIEALQADLARTQRAALQGALLREGLTVVIAGAPNAGKSTLLNRLAGEEVAIVTATPGTTRDLLRARIEVEGLPIELIDTAGLRESSEEAEIEGIRRARRALEQADLVLWIVDASDPSPAEPPPDLPAVPRLRVLNKIDRLPAPPPATDAVSISALQGTGLDVLRQALARHAGYLPGSDALGARRRHLNALETARAALERTRPLLERSASIDLAAEELRLAQRALGEITGEFTSEDLLTEIFASFCIGK